MVTFLLRYIVQRLIASVPVLLGVSILVFLMIHLIPGDPARQIAGMEARPEEVERIRNELGLNDPLQVQYARYLGRLLQGDLGRSLHSRRPVIEDIKERFPVTLQLAVASTVVATIIGVSAGVISAVYKHKWIDHVVMISALLGISMPVFVIGLLAMWLFALHLRWLPSGGLGGPWYTWEGLKHLVLPAVTLAGTSIGIIARLTRSSMLEALRQDYIKTARAKGLSELLVVVKHALRNSLLPVVTYLGLEFGFLLGGAVVTETIFSLPGLGRFLLSAISSRDYPVIQACILLGALFFVVVNLVVDVLYSYLDPRIRYG